MLADRDEEHYMLKKFKCSLDDNENNKNHIIICL